MKLRKSKLAQNYWQFLNPVCHPFCDLPLKAEDMDNMAIPKGRILPVLIVFEVKFSLYLFVIMILKKK